MGHLKFPASPVRIDRQPLPVRMAPRLGEHTAQVLAELGIEPPAAPASRREGTME